MVVGAEAGKRLVALMQITLNYFIQVQITGHYVNIPITQKSGRHFKFQESS
jgi:hypothetical protein